MTPESLADVVTAALSAEKRMTLFLWHKEDLPSTFPVGEKLWEDFTEKTLFAYEPSEVLKWLEENRLIKVELQDDHKKEMELEG